MYIGRSSNCPSGWTMTFFYVYVMPKRSNQEFETTPMTSLRHVKPASKVLLSRHSNGGQSQNPSPNNYYYYNYYYTQYTIKSPVNAGQIKNWLYM